MKIFGKGFNFSQDGPGNRLVYHISGCNLRCPWCSNPEGLDASFGEDMSPLQIAEEANRSRLMFFGGGGVTFTGGEATLSAGELIKTLELLRSLGIHTAIETNGTTSLQPFCDCVDYMIMDFKHIDGDKLRRVTGKGNEQIKKNFELFCANGKKLHVRIPLINGFNTESPRQFAEYFSSHNTENVVFEFLPYHEMGRKKWRTTYTVQDGFITEETHESFKRIFKEYNLTVMET